MGVASPIRTIQTGLSVSLLFLLQAQLNFLHLENNAEDDDMSAQTPPEQRHQPLSKSKIFMIRLSSSDSSLAVTP